MSIKHIGVLHPGAMGALVDDLHGRVLVVRERDRTTILANPTIRRRRNSTSFSTRLPAGNSPMKQRGVAATVRSSHAVVRRFEACRIRSALA